eukprot:53989-Chlamydomonas_euryale.AAC.1
MAVVCKSVGVVSKRVPVMCNSMALVCKSGGVVSNRVPVMCTSMAVVSSQAIQTYSSKSSLSSNAEIKA